MAEDKLIQQVAERFQRIACAKCQTPVDVSALPFFATANCPSCGTPLTVPAQLGNFLLVGHLGAGGMAGVYEAHDRGLGRRVAIKILHTELGVDPKFIDSFLREARAAAQINHVNVVQIYQVGQEKGVPYIVMELLKGGKLEDSTNAGRKLGELQVLDIALDSAKGLRAADAIRLVHGDIKPANILFDKKGIAKIADFGLARFQGKSSSLGNEIWGTPHYIAPETVRKQKPDARADIYSLGATLFHALAGRPPFEGKETKEVVLARLKEPAPPLSLFRKDLTPETIQLVARMLEMDPGLRYPNYSSLIADIEQAIQAAKNRPAGELTAAAGKTGGSSKKYAVAGLAALAVLAGLIVATSGKKDRKPRVAGELPPTRLPVATTSSPVAPAQPFSPADEKALVAGFEFLAQGRDPEAVDAWLKWVKTAPADHPGRPWLVVLHALPAFLAGDSVTVQSRTKPLLDKKYGLQSDGSMHPAVLPQAIARLMVTKKWQDPPANPKGAWPDWFAGLKKFHEGFAKFYNKDLHGGRVLLLDVRNDKSPAPAWVAAFRPLAGRYIGFFDQWDTTSKAATEKLNRKDFYGAVAMLERARDRTPGLLHPVYDNLLDRALKGINAPPERKSKPATDLPFPWMRLDVGKVSEAGRTSLSNGIFKLTHRGGDIWDKNDSLHFAYQSKDGDGTIEARVMSVGGSDRWAKSAVMVREHIGPGSRNAAVILAFSEGTQLQARGTNSELSVKWNGPRMPAPYWLRLTRTGSKFEGFTSADGLAWKSITNTTIEGFPSTALWGLALCSHNTNVATTAEFRNVTIR